MMVLRKWYRWLPAMVLVLSALPVLPAQAMPLDLGLKATGWWTWVVQQVSAAWLEAGAGINPDGTPLEAGADIVAEGAPLDAGFGIDPNGAPLEAGFDIDPNG